MLLAIDPGPIESGWVHLGWSFKDSLPKIIDAGVSRNEDLLGAVEYHDGHLAIEKVVSYGMSVGAEVFETVYWSGRFAQAFHSPDKVIRVPRLDVKLHLCKVSQAKDMHIRQALIDMYGGKDAAIGKKANPGPLYAVKSHAWAALALGITVRETKL